MQALVEHGEAARNPGPVSEPDYACEMDAVEFPEFTVCRGFSGEPQDR